MKSYLSLLASTKNYDAGNAVAAARILEIYHYLKLTKIFPKKETEALVREALQLKKMPQKEIDALLSPEPHLFCFPYAGGNASLYDQWQSHFSGELKLHAIEYPGRGSKSREKLIPILSSLLEELEKEIVSILPQKAPFAFFGHSLGAVIAFELSLLFKEKYHLQPIALFLSGSPPPNVITSFASMANMSDEEFVGAIQELNGIPEALLGTEEFRSFFLPILRNDFLLLEGYERSLQKLSCPLILFGGKDDAKAPLEQLKQWDAWTQNQMILHEIEGDHFFIHQPRNVIEEIRGCLCSLRS